jgi:L-rhamnonate dehydratase
VNRRQLIRRLAGVAGLCGLGDGSQQFVSRAAAQTTSERVAKGSRITQVTATSVSIPCEYAVGSVRRPIRMGGVVAEVETADGLRGHGFAAITNNDVVVAAIRDVIAPFLNGKDAFAREAISEQLYWRLTPRAETGQAVHAISAIDCALWDIAGKSYGEPIWRLLGGARNEVRVYTTCGMNFLSREQLAQVARDVVKSGQTKLKMVVASGATNVDRTGKSIREILAEDATRVRAVREAAGPAAMVSIDANESLDGFEARYLARQIADYDIGFFEEPLRGNDVHDLADFRREVSMPIAAGQNETKLSRWRDMAQANAVDILQLNVCMAGGFTAGIEIAALAKAFGLPIYNAGAYANFNMHLHAGVANGGLCEWHLSAVPMCRILYTGVPELTDGDRLKLPNKPGLGFELNRDALREFAVKPL